jgi:hypothetical protein
MKFEIYTYFGRVLCVFVVPETETHHATYEKAYAFAVEWERATGNPCWMRIK